MSLVEITDKVYKLGNAWEEFKSSNDEKLNELKRRNTFDPLYTEKLEKINKELDSCKQHITNLEIAARRPVFSEEQLENKNKKIQSKRLNNYLRTGNMQIEGKSLNTGSNIAGAILLEEEATNTIISKIQNISPIRQLASVKTISKDSIRVFRADILNPTSNFESHWLDKNTAAVETNTPTIDSVLIPTFLHYAQPKAEQRLLEDSEVDLEKWIIEEVVKTMAHNTMYAFYQGDGITSPNGMLDPAPFITSGIDSDFTAENLINLPYLLKNIFIKNATFLMHRITAFRIRELKNNMGQYLWQPSLQLGQPDTLIGIPVMLDDFMPPLSLDKCILLGDFKSVYQIVDRTGITIIRDDLTEKPFVKFFVTARVGGNVINEPAYIALELRA